ncbi:autophagy-related protein 27 [Suhomyces tanzawaensis NRRL Y-17324]|uniref:Autophagy-related protein 27 n=1 Tax=Suhomyces tanzawaensis NRRL Y-17324 TaxID=984487 RepID=A0A1E4SST1_9ASCO|nr:autophagy-related protein 27 [Suhomyces tanzawaensis NRRL Y-17324]ODV82452.1 autophagy-related protein 27 [Suhomyces tanzawaensis NRRL Y-17324]
MFKLVVSALALLASTTAIDCGAKELSAYNFESFKGIHSLSVLKDTPPSHTNNTWYFGVCDTINEGVDKCPRNSDICGITTISVDKQEVVSEVIGFNSNLQKAYEPFDKDNSQGIVIRYKNANWGENLVDAEITFTCPGSGDKDALDVFQLDKWDGDVLQVSVKTKAACITDNKHKDKPSTRPNDNGESWGWFTWIFIFMVLFLSIYIVGGAWFQYNKGNSIDFQTALKEVLENFVDLLRGLPAFVREIVEKVTGNGNRGEYSAV